MWKKKNAGDGTNSGISYNAAPLQYLAMEEKGKSPKQYPSQPSSIQGAYIIYIQIGEWACYGVQTEALAWSFGNSVGQKKLLDVTWETVG